jgi:pimeloyl-ACP methyl ester carboxylesterase
MNPNDRFFTANGVRLHLVDWGTAGRPGVFLLHGMAVHARSWDHHAEALSTEFHVIAVDQRGHGDSEHVGRGGYTSEPMSLDILGLADQLGWARFSVVGQSMGGHVGMHIAANHPGRLACLVISDMEPVFRMELLGPMRTIERLPVFQSHDELIARYTARAPRTSPELHRARAMHALKPAPGGGWMEKFDIAAPTTWAPADLWADLGRIGCPTLLLRGGDSEVLLPETAERMRAGIPNCEYLEVDGAGHAIGSDQPAIFGGAVREFLRRHAG